MLDIDEITYFIITTIILIDISATITTVTALITNFVAGRQVEVPNQWFDYILSPPVLDDPRCVEIENVKLCLPRFFLPMNWWEEFGYYWHDIAHMKILDMMLRIIIIRYFIVCIMGRQKVVLWPCHGQRRVTKRMNEQTIVTIHNEHEVTMRECTWFL